MTFEIGKSLGINNDVDQKAAEFLESAIKENTSPGFDYLKFKSSIEAMSQLGLSDDTAYKSAFATAKTMGVTKAGLTKSAKHYLSVLMSEKSKFDEALNNRVQEHIATKGDQVIKLQNQIEQMKLKIKELESKIASYEGKIASADEDVEKEKRKIEDTKEKFERTYTAYVGAIEQDLEKIKDYLKA